MKNSSCSLGLPSFPLLLAMVKDYYRIEKNIAQVILQGTVMLEIVAC